MVRCKSIITDGTQCKRNSIPGRRYCWQHESGRFRSITVLGVIGTLIAAILTGVGFWADLLQLGLPLPVLSSDTPTIQTAAPRSTDTVLAVQTVEPETPLSAVTEPPTQIPIDIPLPDPTGVATGTSEAFASPETGQESDHTIAVVSDVRGYPDIYLMTMEGAIIQQVTNDAAEEQHLSWSPDGNSLAYATDVAGNFDIYVFDFATDGIQSPVANFLAESAPTWSPDSSMLAFHSYVSQENADIFIVDLTKEADFEPFVTNEADDWQPVWSPDGTKIAFMTNRDGNWEIYIRDVSGLNEVNITRHPSDDHSPDWSPDGNQIVFSSDRDGDSEIYVVDVSSRSLRQLTDNVWGDWTPTWSPNGSKIVFSSLRNGNYDIYVMNTDGAGEERIVENTSREEYPVFRPVTPP